MHIVFRNPNTSLRYRKPPMVRASRSQAAQIGHVAQELIVTRLGYMALSFKFRHDPAHGLGREAEDRTEIFTAKELAALVAAAFGEPKQ